MDSCLAKKAISNTKGPVNDEQKNIIESLKKEDPKMSREVIAEKAKCTPNQVGAVLQALIKANKVTSSKTIPLTDEKKEQIKDIRTSQPKLTRDLIAEEVGCTPSQVKIYLGQAKIYKNAPSSTSGPLEEAHEETIIEWRKKGKSSKDILHILSNKYKDRKFSIGQVNNFCFAGIQEGTVERQIKVPFVLTPEEKK